MLLSPDRIMFCLLSFEGPDAYAQAGGLGVRVTHLAQTLARRGFETHLFFVGDPTAPGVEATCNGRFILHRWSQWLSANYPQGVYAGEEEKLRNFNDSLPPYLVAQLIQPAIAQGRIPVVLAEEWHTAEALTRLHDQLLAQGLRRQCVLFWNANNTMSFHRVDWGRLQTAAQLTTVSRYMKHLMWQMGLNPLVIPNGIPADLLQPVEPSQVAALQSVLNPDGTAVMLFKVGRFDPAKRWLMAMQAAAQIKASGHRIVFPLRGGIEPHGHEVFDLARALDLTITDVNSQPRSWEHLLDALHTSPRADLYHLQFAMDQELLRPFYAAADGVLANSGHEPFGLVGLEAMCAGGLVFTGATGEEYTMGGQCAVPLDTDAPEEIVSQLLSLKADAPRANAMRTAARTRAAAFTWDQIVEMLLDKIKFVAQTTAVLPDTGWGTHANGRPCVQDVLIYTVIHQPRRLRLPAAPLTPGAAPDVLAQALFDEPLNERYFRKVAATCYYPAVAKFASLVQRGFKFALGFSLSFIEQAQRWDEGLLDQFCRLVQHENVELVAVEPTHSFVLLWDLPRFMMQMQDAAARLQQIFGMRPVIADTTELMMSDAIYHALDLAGFKAGLLDGRPWVMEWREPTHLYEHNGGRMKLFTRHYQLSDDVGYRFSNRGWSGWPLRADQYASWLAQMPGELVVLGWDFETFGEHHHVESGIFEFLDALPHEVQRRELSFTTPSEALARYAHCCYDLPLPVFASTWAGSGGLDFFLGNDAQRAVYQLMVQAYNKARLTGNPALVDLSLWLAQSDNLHLIQWYGRSGDEAAVSAYFTPREWWALGGERIIWEIQQVYKNFIHALDAHLPEPTKFA